MLLVLLAGFVVWSNFRFFNQHFHQADSATIPSLRQCSNVSSNFNATTLPVEDLIMETSEKIKLSSDLIITKLVCIFGLLLSLTLVFGKSKNAIDDDFKTGLEYKLLLVATTALTGYLLTRPSISYDDLNLYIKKISGKQIQIPLKNVKSFFENPLSVSRGTAIYTIEYKNDLTETNSIKFAANYSSESIKNFKAVIKKINPHVEIV